VSAIGDESDRTRNKLLERIAVALERQLEHAAVTRSMVRTQHLQLLAVLDGDQLLTPAQERDVAARWEGVRSALADTDADAEAPLDGAAGDARGSHPHPEK
jgi:hypothetical protein